MPRAPARRTYHHGDLRRSLMEAALGLVAEKGVHALSIREAAQRAGVSSGAPYRHFPSKDALLAALATDGYRDLGERLQRARERGGDDFRRQVQAAAEAYLEVALAHPDRFRLMFGGFFPSHAEFPELFAACAATEEILLDMLRDGQAAGAVKALPVALLATTTHAFIHGLASLLIEGHLALPPDESLAAWIAPLFDAFWRGLSA